MKLYCVRHGETFHNLAGRIQGQTDSQLTDLGLRQCRAVAEALEPMPVDAVLSSPLSRALDSARCVAERLKLNVEVDPRLMEINAGIFQGLCWDEIEQQYPDEAVRWRSQDPDYRIPGGESRRDLMQRAGEVFATIRQAGYRQAVVVAHGGLLSAAFKALLEIPPKYNPFVLSNGSISVVQWEREVKLLRVNDTTHLRDAVSGNGDL
jgi:broad specificity phosphatase PhoE